MTTIASDELIAQLDSVIRGGSPERCGQILRQLTNLFLSNADRLDRQQLDVFDDVYVRLVERLEPDKLAPPELHNAVQTVRQRIAAQTNAKAPGPIDYSQAKSSILALSHTGKLGDSAVNRLAVHREHTHLVAALSLLADAPIDIIEHVMQADDRCGLLVACRASRLSWQTTLAVINSCSHPRKLSQREIEQGIQLFESLPLSVAQRKIRFGPVGESAGPGLKHRGFSAARAS